MVRRLRDLLDDVSAGSFRGRPWFVVCRLRDLPDDVQNFPRSGRVNLGPWLTVSSVDGQAVPAGRGSGISVSPSAAPDRTQSRGKSENSRRTVGAVPGST